MRGLVLGVLAYLLATVVAPVVLLWWRWGG